jgi:hypothetical protein
MQSLAGPFLIASVVLALAGVRKLVDPDSTRGALRQMGLPWRGPVVVLLAVGEVFTGLYAAIDGSRAAGIAVMAWYLGFAVFVAVALRRSVPLASCGCLGKPDTPPTPAHLLVNVLFTAVALGVAIDPYGPTADLLGDQPAAGVPLLLWVGLGVYVTYLVLAVLPATLEATAAARVRRAARAAPS